MPWRYVPRGHGMFEGERRWWLGFTKLGPSLTIYLGWWTWVHDSEANLFDRGLG
jgi:hypothetical protein